MFEIELAGSRYRIRTLIRCNSHANLAGTIQVRGRGQSQTYRNNWISGIRTERMHRKKQHKYSLRVELREAHSHRRCFVGIRSILQSALK